MNLNSVPWSLKEFSLLNQNQDLLNVLDGENQPIQCQLRLMPFHQMKEACRLKYHYQASIISQRSSPSFISNTSNSILCIQARLYISLTIVLNLHCRKRAVNSAWILNLKMLWLLNPSMDSLVQKDLQLFTLRDPPTLLQWEELIVRYASL